MFQRFLVILENEQIHAPAVDYARHLARRMDAEVSILMLVGMTFHDSAGVGGKRCAVSDLEQRAGGLLAELSAKFIQDGVTTGVALRLGDQAQELVKFLAERPPFKAVIWGSGHELPGPAHRHWLAKAMGSLECPLWTVASAAIGAEPARGSEKKPQP